MENHFSISGQSLAKRFKRNVIFKNIDFTITTGESLAITGANGSGKSTLLKITAGLLSPSKGLVTYKNSETKIEPFRRTDYFGYVSPDMNPYPDLTVVENIKFMTKKKEHGLDFIDLIKIYDLEKHQNKLTKQLSSGLKQRLKFIMAIVNDPPILFFDEPAMNLDREGKDLLYENIETMMKDKLVLIATNEKEEEKLCKEVLTIGE